MINYIIGALLGYMAGTASVIGVIFYARKKGYFTFEPKHRSEDERTCVTPESEVDKAIRLYNLYKEN